MKLQFVIFASAAVFLLGSCDSTKTAVADQPTTSSGSRIDQNTSFTKIPTETFWRLETLDGVDFSTFTKDGNEIGFTMFADNSRLSGYAGCNNFYGTYSLEPGNRIKFSEIGSTRMMCPDGDFSENEFLKVFALAENFSLRGNRLELKTGSGAPLAVFTGPAIPLKPIVEKYWKLKTLNGKKVKREKDREQEIHFTLNPRDNTVTGFAGCNTISGSFKLEGDNEVFFSQMIATMKACPDMDFNEWEFIKVFELADTYQIKGKKLELFGKANVPLAVFEVMPIK